MKYRHISNKVHIEINVFILFKYLKELNYNFLSLKK